MVRSGKGCVIESVAQTRPGELRSNFAMVAGCVVSRAITSDITDAKATADAPLRAPCPGETPRSFIEFSAQTPNLRLSVKGTRPHRVTTEHCYGLDPSTRIRQPGSAAGDAAVYHPDGGDPSGPVAQRAR